MITLDGVMQGPGGPEEDTSNGFEYCGWIAGYPEDEGGEFMQENMKATDLLLGRTTFDIWENYWPQHAEYWPGVNEVEKYVLSTTRDRSDWQNTTFLKSVEDIKNLKNSDGSDLKVWGSSEVVQLLLGNDLVDELRLIIYPLTLGKGKKIFDSAAIPAAFKITESMISPSGIIFANYVRAGEVKTGSVGP